MTAETGPVAAVLAQAIHDAECEAYTHEGRNARCVRSARAGVAALVAAGFRLADPAATDTSAARAKRAMADEIERGLRNLIPTSPHMETALNAAIGDVMRVVRAVRDTTEPEEQQP